MSDTGAAALKIRVCTCGQPGTKKCAACGLAYYCSRACQCAAWPDHKTWCRSAKIREVSGAELLVDALEGAQRVLDTAETMKASGAPPLPESLDEYCDMFIGVVGPSMVTLQPVRAILLRACEAFEAVEKNRPVGEALRRRLA